MGEPRRNSGALRGLAVAAGLAVVAGSATQVVTTMSAPIAVRTATQNVATANYFPAPLPTGLTCITNGIWGTRSVTLNWTAPPRPAGAAPYRYLVTWSLNGVTPKYTFDTANTTTGEFRIRDQLTLGESTDKSYRIFVKTINPTDPTVVSSGSVSWTVESPTGPSSRCAGETGFRVENQPWENQVEWTPAVTGFVATGRMFVSMAAELSGGTLDEALPPEDDLRDLTDVPPPAPASDGSDPTSPGAGPGSGAGSGADTSSSPTEPGGPVPGDDAAPSPTDPAVGPADSATGGTATTPSEPTLSPSEPSSETSSGPLAPTVPPRLTATLGSGAITVGAVEATLAEVDGQPTVLLSSGGAPVCTVAVPGASAIENSGGTLIVTGTDPDRTVDTSTCALT